MQALRRAREEAQSRGWKHSAAAAAIQLDELYFRILKDAATAAEVWLADSPTPSSFCRSIFIALNIANEASPLALFPPFALTVCLNRAAPPHRLACCRRLPFHSAPAPQAYVMKGPIVALGASKPKKIFENWAENNTQELGLVEVIETMAQNLGMAMAHYGEGLADGVHELEREAKEKEMSLVPGGLKKADNSIIQLDNVDQLNKLKVAGSYWGHVGDGLIKKGKYGQRAGAVTELPVVKEDKTFDWAATAWYHSSVSQPELARRAKYETHENSACAGWKVLRDRWGGRAMYVRQWRALTIHHP